MKNGKLFGKINIIDLFVVLVILAALVFVGLRFLGGDSSPIAATPDKVRLTFFAEEAPSLLTEQGESQLGGPVTDYDTKKSLGVLTAFSAEDSYYRVYDEAEDKTYQLDNPAWCWITFSCEGEGYLSEDGLRVGGETYSIGGSYTICAGQLRVFCRLASIEKLG